MPFVEQILHHRSLSIVGLDKNTGKTVCLNYILRRVNEMGVHVGVTSIGVDGEQVDSVFATAKPEITLFEGTHFTTSEQHYMKRQTLSEIVHVDDIHTALGKLVTARVVIPGKVLLSGAASTAMLKRQISTFEQLGVGLSIVDGALSRLSLASPAITECMILATGAAVSPNIKQLIAKTRFQLGLINLDPIEDRLADRLKDVESGIWGIDPAEGEPHDLGITSVFLLNEADDRLLRYGSTLFAAGAVSDRLLKALTQSNKPITIIAKDFTKIFVTPEVYNTFLRAGHRMQVMQRTKLIAITLNPTSPQGYLLDSHSACDALSQAVQMPVYDVMKIAL